MAGGRPKEPLVLADEEREQLERWARRPKTSQRLAVRSRIVLACAEGEDNTDVAETLAVSKATVGKWRKRFLDKRLDGLVDEPRPGAPRTIAKLLGQFEQSDSVLDDLLVGGHDRHSMWS